MRALGIETSCDETAAALVEADASGVRLTRQRLATRPEESTSLGGIVPELTVRQHLELLPKLMREVLAEAGQPEAVGATAGPGLAPALLVGLALENPSRGRKKLPFMPSTIWRVISSRRLFPAECGRSFPILR